MAGPRERDPQIWSVTGTPPFRPAPSSPQTVLWGQALCAGRGWAGALYGTSWSPVTHCHCHLIVPISPVTPCPRYGHPQPPHSPTIPLTPLFVPQVGPSPWHLDTSEDSSWPPQPWQWPPGSSEPRGHQGHQDHQRHCGNHGHHGHLRAVVKKRRCLHAVLALGHEAVY